jgi:hypothetical protein
MDAQAESGRRSSRGPSDDVTASEAASYAFCAKAWHLERVLRVAPSADSSTRRERGVARHRAHGGRVALLQSHGRALAWVGAALLVVASLFALAALAFVR